MEISLPRGSMGGVKFFNPYAEIHVSRNRLPHWQQAGACYFLTFRLADSLPEHLLANWRDEREHWLAAHPPPRSEEVEADYHRRFSASIDAWLDVGHGSCLLSRQSCRDAVSDAMCFFDQERYELLSWVIMPNHVHVCLLSHPDWTLDRVVHSWKRKSAVEINRRGGRGGRLWVRDYFDRLIRDEVHWRNVIRYIRRNPEKANLGKGRSSLWEGEFARGVT